MRRSRERFWRRLLENQTYRYVYDKEFSNASTANDGAREKHETPNFSFDERNFDRNSLIDSVPLSPVRPLYRDIAVVSAMANVAQVELVGLTLELDLPEMDAMGAAVITGISQCPTVRGGTGQPVTATFLHPPSTAVLGVVFEGESRPIGVTDNHLFWSADRQEFLRIEEIHIGENVQTYQGRTKSIEQKVRHSDAHVVYNFEVYGEHVYYVGLGGVLAHNACPVLNENLQLVEAYANNQQVIDLMHAVIAVR